MKPFDLEIIKLKLQPDASALDHVGTVQDKIQNALSKHKINAICTPGGSVAKGTFIGKDFDVDLFVRFHKSYETTKLSDLLESALEEFQPIRIKGSRDYFQFNAYTLEFEVIPVLNIKKHHHAKNLTDMSPLHVDHVRKHLEKNPQLADDIRLAKQFCKAANAYGAESHINGISGHVLDLLVIHHDGFMNFIQRVAIWDEQEIIDLSKKVKNPKQTLNKSKTTGPLIVVDPVQPDRNAAAALSLEKFNLLKQSAKEFLENPSEKFFTIQPLNPAQLKKEGAHIITITPLEGKKDVVGTKIIKVLNHLRQNLAERGFTITDSGFDMKLIYLFTEEHKIPPTFIHKGPPIEQKNRADAFKKKWGKTTYEKEGILYTKRKRDFIHAADCIKHHLKDPYVKERLKKCSLKS